MKNIKNKVITAVIASLILAGGMIALAENPGLQLNKLTPINLNKEVKSTPAKVTAAPIAEGNYTVVSSLAVVNDPEKYLGKNIKFKAVFDKFSTLGLDYKPAFRDSQKYITFLIKRDDVTDHTVPLAEMKIFLKRTDAEKFIDLDSGDVIEVYGKVFSNALTDTWMDAEKLVIVEKKNKDKDKPKTVGNKEDEKSKK